jgi:hypothetical protein
MCFVLYAGTSKPLPRREWNKDAPDLAIQSLSEREAPVRAHFTTPEVQFIGSTAGCGCDFPFVTLQNGQWPIFDFGEKEKSTAERDYYNRKALVDLLRETGEETIELYGIWDGDGAKSPQAMEDIRLVRVLDSDFHFKEQGFYKVNVKTR